MGNKVVASSSHKPLYIQVKNVLIDRIQNQIWLPNSLIPTEQELMEEFEVSRTTIREAISILVHEGILEKKQGKGTIVKTARLVGDLGKLKGFAEEVMEKGLIPFAQLIRAEFNNKMFYEKSILEVQKNENILVIERIRLADDIPIALERTCWPEEIGKLLMMHDLNGAKFYEILENNNIFLKHADERISAINATINEADFLGIRAGEALLEMSRLSFGFNDRPIEYNVTKYRSDQYHYDIKLDR
ncbi:GntR family transcriptional regulator [Neobacillus mesonae]|uniref:GntR family transcriptional regulator n=1 Tax=Neobacillus mesonae TaxID=1193713 RepID=UPI00203BCB48|nr:GntR family transcriptional regulator [Neobacillus mesonae]MCM3571002.1 GntR family transcriptional regulator [Neobacillus mesonae]